MKSLTKRYLQAIVAYNCRYWQHCHEHFECFYSNTITRQYPTSRSVAGTTRAGD